MEAVKSVIGTAKTDVLKAFGNLLTTPMTLRPLPVELALIFMPQYFSTPEDDVAFWDRYSKKFQEYRSQPLAADKADGFVMPDPREVRFLFTTTNLMSDGSWTGACSAFIPSEEFHDISSDHAVTWPVARKLGKIGTLLFSFVVHYAFIDDKACMFIWSRDQKDVQLPTYVKTLF